MQRLLFCLTSLLFVSACQNSSQISAPPIDIQLTQLSALIGSTEFLRDHCNRGDIPANNKSIEYAAMLAAKEKGWDTSKYNQLDSNGTIPAYIIQQRQKSIYQNLSKDETPLSVKCNELNATLVPFIQLIQRKPS